MSSPLALLVALALACAAPAVPPAAPSDASPPSVPVAAVPTAAGEQPSLDPGSRLTDIHGKVARISDDWWGLVPDFDPEGSRFAPDPPLTHEYRVDGLRVVFSGVVGEIPPDVRMWGTPLKLEAIRKE